MDEGGSGWHPAIFWVGASLTAVGGAATALSGIDTKNNPGAQRVQDECTTTDCKLYQDGLAKQKRTNILLGVTGGLALFTVVAAVLTDWGSDEKESEVTKRSSRPKRQTALQVEPWMTVGSGAMFGAQARF